MEGGGERGDIAREAHHGGVKQSGSDTSEHKDKTVDSEKDGQFQVQPRWRKFLDHVGPGALVAIGFLDPSNLETDLQAGADFKYELLWVILVGMIFALLIQTLAANLGVKTGRHLAELCREEYPRHVNICLWIIAELAVISDDIPEVLGTAFAFNILLKIPVWAGVILTVFSTLLLLGVQRFGARKLEFIIAAFMFTMAACFFGELSYLRPSAREVAKGMFVPSLQGKGAAANAIALFGAIITPYNLFLHSALVLSRKTPRSDKSIRAACRFFLIECSLAFIVAFLINVSVVVVAGTICNSNSLSSADANTCGDLTLQSAPLLLRNILGRSSSIVFAIALLASGQSTTISCTFAGQVIMQGFLDMKMKNWVRNLITRIIAIAPSLIVSVVSGPSGAGKLIVLSSIILSFELPFALIPLLKFCNSSKKVGPLKESIYGINWNGMKCFQDQRIRWNGMVPCWCLVEVIERLHILFVWEDGTRNHVIRQISWNHSVPHIEDGGHLLDPQHRAHRRQHLLPSVDLRGLACPQPSPQVRQRPRLRRRFRAYGRVPRRHRLPGVQERHGGHVRLGVGEGAGPGRGRRGTGVW